MGLPLDVPKPARLPRPPPLLPWELIKTMPLLGCEKSVQMPRVDPGESRVELMSSRWCRGAV